MRGYHYSVGLEMRIVGRSLSVRPRVLALAAAVCMLNANCRGGCVDTGFDERLVGLGGLLPKYNVPVNGLVAPTGSYSGARGVSICSELVNIGILSLCSDFSKALIKSLSPISSIIILPSELSPG